MSTTPNELIKRSLRLIGAISTGETPSASEGSDGLVSLNALLSSWSTEGLNIRQETREVFPITAGKSTYTFGPLGDFPSTKPVKIYNVTLMDSLIDSFETPVEMIAQDDFAKIYNKSLQTSFPTHVFAFGTAPLETLQFYPIPSISKAVVIYSEKPLGGFVTLSDVINFPEGYERAIVYNLAVEISPEYGREASPTVASIAQESKAMIMRLNTDPQFMISDLSGFTNGKYFNILKGR